MTETVDEKAARYLKEGRMRVERVEPPFGLVVAHCQGETGEYALGYDPSVKQWRCTCPELQHRCSHLAALKMVVRR